ncbi:hypothetical protein DYB37_009761 [Aphanomyces astaci]|uniref:Low temperature requirement protein LtrA n=1 Tax=Aphanomyces astaci TaxID=112090 RepID=A0A397CWE9_APHAT|nr:hypothetical protein AaE_014041 [Aphanomyces astaci]RHY03731.1 hypothetical protein DYB36_003475 [Aphanomyces astaci]RHY37656.1 hypothetical protein DYB25_008194 [Aphanomyces astaci]RHY51171.1 hypothetical protein DYB30_003483 [Aphanomyces astaci]RHY56438.1 hypothetical protein DYB34_008116 [Aphanomyces astaci]
MNTSSSIPATMNQSSPPPLRAIVKARSLIRRNSTGSQSQLLTRGGLIHMPMRARDPKEAHRVSSALEKLYDLTLVVGLSAVSHQFAEHIQAGHDLAHGFLMFFMSFFALWNAWLPFVWFSSTYDVDDVCYRLGAMGQMMGILMVSDGIDHNMGEILSGYILLRLCYTFLFRFRAAYQDPPHRSVNIKHGVASVVIMVGWYAQQTIADDGNAWFVVVFAAIGLCDLAAPALVEHFSTPKMPFHPHHISERYSEFTIIVFGESLLSVSHSTVLKPKAFNVEALKTSSASVLLLFALWWLYFLVPFGKLLHDHPHKVHFVGYGHYVIHIALAGFATGLYLAGLATHEDVVVTQTRTRELAGTSSDVSITTASWVVAISLSVYIVIMPILIAAPWFSLAKNIVVAVAFLLTAAFVTPYVTVGTLLWVYCVPVLLFLPYVIWRTRRKV